MPLQELLAHPLSGAATLALLHFLWQGVTISLGLVAVVELLGLRRPQVRYLCSLVALLLMTACPLATLAWLTQAEETGDRGQETVVAAVAQVGTSALRPNEWQAADLIAAAQPYVLAAWLAGVAFFACRLLMGLVGVERLRRQRLPLPRELSQRVEQLGRRLGMRARSMVFLSGRVGEAMAVGLVKPIVLIPAAWATEMPLAMLEAVIAHELAHLQRHDLWVNLLQRVVETLLFYHPAVWWLSRRLRAERELCCDELAVALTGRRLEYVQALESVARMGTRVEPLLAAAIRGERNMQLLERVRNVLGLSAAGQSSRLWPAALVALLLPLAAWAWTAGLVTPQSAVAVADDDREDNDDDDDDDEKEVRKEGDKDRDDDDDDEKEVRKEGNKDRDDDDDDKPAAKKVEKERDDDDGDEKEVRKEGDKARDDDGDDKEVRKEGERKEIRKDGDDSEAAREKRARIEKLKFLGKEEEIKRYGVKKEEPRDGEKPVKIAPKDGEKPVKFSLKDGEKQVKENEGRVAELLIAVKKLTAENERLQAELFKLRGGKKEAAADEKEAFYKRAFEKEAAVRAIKRAAVEKAEAAAEKEEAAVRERKIKEGGERSEAEIRERKIKAAQVREAEDKSEAEIRERKIKAAQERGADDKEAAVRRERELIEKKAEAAERERKEGNKQ